MSNNGEGDTATDNPQGGMLSTKDNPYSPFTQWDEWLAFDEQKGYNTNSLLARIAVTSDDLPEKQNELEIERAMKEFVALDPFQMYEIRTK